MKLSTKDRVLIPMFLPKQGKMIEMLVCKSILDSTEFSSEEVTALQLKDLPGGGVEWNPLKAQDIEINFSEAQIQLLKAGIERLDEAGLLTIDMLPLCDKIYN